jgi:phosphohistidine phosphatase
VKTVLLMRHAEAEPENPDQSDFERVLTHYGQTTALQTGRQLQLANTPIQRVLASAAVRTHLTAALVARTAAPSAPLQLSKDLYAASHHRIAQVLFSICPPDETSILLVGHNPGIAALIYQWLGRTLEVPPCTLIALQADTDDWHQIPIAPRTPALLIRHGSREPLP